MKISRRHALVSGIGGLAVTAAPVISGAELSPPPEGWSIWLRAGNGAGSKMLGALGKHSCCGFQSLLTSLMWEGAAEEFVHCTGPAPEVAFGAVAIDIHLFLESPTVVETIPDGWGWFLVAPVKTEMGDVVRAQELVRDRASWVGLLGDSLSPCPLPFDELIDSSFVQSFDGAARFLGRMFECPHLFEVVREQGRAWLCDSWPSFGNVEHLLESKSALTWLFDLVESSSNDLRGLIHYQFGGNPSQRKLAEAHVAAIRKATSTMPVVLIEDEPDWDDESACCFAHELVLAFKNVR